MARESHGESRERPSGSSPQRTVTLSAAVPSGTTASLSRNSSSPSAPSRVDSSAEFTGARFMASTTTVTNGYHDRRDQSNAGMFGAAAAECVFGWISEQRVSDTRQVAREAIIGQEQFLVFHRSKKAHRNDSTEPLHATIVTRTVGPLKDLRNVDGEPETPCPCPLCSSLCSCPTNTRR